MKSKKNPPFWAIFSHFRINKKFSGKCNSVIFTVSRFLLPCKISEKTNKQILRKTSYMHSYVQMDDHIFIGTLLLRIQKEYISHESLRSNILSNVVNQALEWGWGIQGKSCNSNVSLTYPDIQIMIRFLLTERNDNNT